MKKELLIDYIVFLLIERVTGKTGNFTLEDAQNFSEKNTINALKLALLPYFLASISKKEETEFNFKFFLPWKFINIFKKHDGTDIIIMPEYFEEGIEKYYTEKRDANKYLSLTLTGMEMIEKNIQKINTDEKMFIDKQFNKLIKSVPIFFEWSDKKWLEIVGENSAFKIFKNKMLAENKLGAYSYPEIKEDKIYFLIESQHFLSKYNDTAL